MSKQQFLSNNRGINNGKDVDQSFLENLYDSIVTNEIAMEQERYLHQRTYLN
jgi:brefeldin A-inhibited guanine nucleotide-exchange protein